MSSNGTIAGHCGRVGVKKMLQLAQRGFGTGLHLDEEGIGVGLGDEADDRFVSGIGGGGAQANA
jgi:hypothetical protein